MTDLELQHRVEQFLFDTAELCDRQQWEDYLACFEADAEFHIPQWDSEHVATTDPQREMSMIWYGNRQGLEDRIYRIRTGKSAASSPMPRTLHLIGNVRIVESMAQQLRVKAKWTTQHVRFGQSGCYFGEVEYTLRKTADGGLRIARKHVLLLNDRINEVLDFYHV